MSDPDPFLLDRAAYLATGESQGIPEDERPRLDRLRATLAEEAMWSGPRPELLEEIVARLESAPIIPLPSRRARGAWRVRLVGLAAAVVLLVAGVLVPGRRISDDDPGSEVALAGTEVAPGASATAVVRDTPNGVAITLRVEGLAPAPDGFYYQAWVTGPAGPVAIGTFHLRGDDGGPIELWSGVDAVDYPQITVTIEPEDGDPASSGARVVAGTLG